MRTADRASSEHAHGDCCAHADTNANAHANADTHANANADALGGCVLRAQPSLGALQVERGLRSGLDLQDDELGAASRSRLSNEVHTDDRVPMARLARCVDVPGRPVPRRGIRPIVEADRIRTGVLLAAACCSPC